MFAQIDSGVGNGRHGLYGRDGPGGIGDFRFEISDWERRLNAEWRISNFGRKRSGCENSMGVESRDCAGQSSGRAHLARCKSGHGRDERTGAETVSWGPIVDCRMQIANCRLTEKY